MRNAKQQDISASAAYVEGFRELAMHATTHLTRCLLNIVLLIQSAGFAVSDSDSDCCPAAGFCASAYVAPKAAVLSLANALRLEVRSCNVMRL